VRWSDQGVQCSGQGAIRWLHLGDLTVKHCSAPTGPAGLLPLPPSGRPAISTVDRQGSKAWIKWLRLRASSQPLSLAKTSLWIVANPKASSPVRMFSAGNQTIAAVRPAVRERETVEVAMPRATQACAPKTRLAPQHSNGAYRLTASK